MSKPQSGHRNRTAGSSMVEVKAVTWNKDSHGLFDYENSYYDMKKFQISDSTCLYRRANDIVSQPKQASALELDEGRDTELLLSVSRVYAQSEKYTIDVNKDARTGTQNQKAQYLIVRSLKNSDGRSQRGYSLEPGDTMKLGRVEYRVVEIRTPNRFQCVDSHMDSCDLQRRQVFDADESKTLAEKRAKGETVVCKYCLLETVAETGDELDNLMLFICDCCEGVHFHCLKVWMQYKIISKATQSVTSYQWKKLDCEICLKQWPKKVRFRGKEQELITLNRPAGPYMILEKVSTDPGSPSTMNIIAPAPNSEVKLGRGHQCDLRISDISVSRIHTHIKLEGDRFLAYDNDSKFGTLILLTKDYEVKSEKAAIQIGRTVFTFVLKNPGADTTIHPNSGQL